ncbi:MAG: hypothetical protein JKY01_09405 [Pseudomonadales bacterium]|nr:hypothetical protein [Pseudomonadales bacterium]
MRPFPDYSGLSAPFCANLTSHKIVLKQQAAKVAPQGGLYANFNHPRRVYLRIESGG